MLLADYFTNNDSNMIAYVKKAAQTNHERPYLLDMVLTNFIHTLLNLDANLSAVIDRLIVIISVDSS